MRDQAHGQVRDYLFRHHQVRFLPTALATDFTDQSSVDPGEPFLMTHVTGHAFDTATRLMVIPNATVNIRLGGPGGRSLSRDPIHWMNAVGSSTRPRFLCAPYYLRNTTLHVTLQLLSGPLTLQLSLKFHGYTVRRFTP